MAETDSLAALLHVALEDLHSGKTTQALRLPGLAAKCSDRTLVAVVTTEAARVAVQARRIAERVKMASPRNLWIAGILDDAERDTRQILSGPLLDIALIGAIRKAKASEIVSHETAVALARRINISDLLAVTEELRTEDIAADRALKVRLQYIVSQTGHRT
ncbi:DUF892 family protein [Sphingomonas baiyangensis]|uniref:DUF892 family protein n=1 Tax=Sphingomonas baiyangensis TaxID=2572576 RepID=A0A4U1L476_9SPHN|nr:DUF892 family protein [Sphingomonas baiyangensis]TKD51552.1 DUF892 family protein [Sphingomonas baiyangensis]